MSSQPRTRVDRLGSRGVRRRRDAALDRLAPSEVEGRSGPRSSPPIPRAFARPATAYSLLPTAHCLQPTAGGPTWLRRPAPSRVFAAPTTPSRTCRRSSRWTVAFSPIASAGCLVRSSKQSWRASTSSWDADELACAALRCPGPGAVSEAHGAQRMAHGAQPVRCFGDHPRCGKGIARLICYLPNPSRPAKELSGASRKAPRPTGS